MIRVKLSTSFPEWPLQRQTPNESGIWGNCQFFINQDVAECDYWVVIDDVLKTDESLCAKSNTILFILEPPTVKSYRRKFLAQFSSVVSCGRFDLEHPSVTYAQPGLPWHVGRQVLNETNRGFRLNYDELTCLAPPNKQNCISVICSNRATTDNHRRRLEFVHQLQRHFGPRLHVFGRGINHIEDKWDAIAPYEYHIVLENSSFPHYWTEKLSDAFLGWSFPFYYGCPNLEEYFSPTAFMRIDIGNLDGSVNLIEDTIANERYEQSKESLTHARRLVLDSYNLFPVIAKLCKRVQTTEAKRKISIKPSGSFEPRRQAIYQKIRNRVLFTARAHRLSTDGD